jgi:hypothetical protein
VDGTLVPGRESKTFSFSAAKGERLFFDQLSGDTSHITWRLIDAPG